MIRESIECIRVIADNRIREMDWDRDREIKDREGMWGWVGIRIG